MATEAEAEEEEIEIEETRINNKVAMRLDPFNPRNFAALLKKAFDNQE